MTSRQPSHPARSRRRIVLVVVLLILVAGAAGGGYGLWYLFFRPSGPPALAAQSLAPLPSIGAAAALPSGGLEGHLERRHDDRLVR